MKSLKIDPRQLNIFDFINNQTINIYEVLSVKTGLVKFITTDINLFNNFKKKMNLKLLNQINLCLKHIMILINILCYLINFIFIKLMKMI